MIEKLTETICIHVTRGQKRKLETLAAIAGKAPSEYDRVVLIEHLNRQQELFNAMREVFGSPDSMDSEGDE